MQALYATPIWACCYIFTFSTWCTMPNTWFMLSPLCLQMSSFLHTCACMMPRTFLPSREILFPVYTADRISGLESVVLWLSRWRVVKKGRLLSKGVFCQGHLPSRVVFCQRSSSVKGCLLSKVVFRIRSPSVKGCLPSKFVFCQRLSSVRGRLPS